MEKDDLILVKARVRLQTPEEGGRQMPVHSGYRPNHVFEWEENLPLHTYIGDIHWEGDVVLPLGEVKLVTVRFLRMPVMEKYIKLGQKWRVHEGAKVVGDAEIVEIFARVKKG